MPLNSQSLEGSFIPEEPLHPQAAQFFAQVTDLLDGQTKDEVVVEAALLGWDELLEKIGADLYRISSMLLGEGEDSIRLIEKTVTELDIEASSSHAEARHRARLLLGGEAIALLASRDTMVSSFVAPEADDSGPVSCIEDDDLSAAGVTSADLEQMLEGPDNARLRDWLEGLSESLRVIFVLRAIANLTSAEVAGLLSEHGGPAAQDWTPDAIRSGFRQALCSLASQLLHASATK